MKRLWLHVPTTYALLASGSSAATKYFHTDVDTDTKAQRKSGCWKCPGQTSADGTVCLMYNTVQFAGYDSPEACCESAASDEDCVKNIDDFNYESQDFSKIDRSPISYYTFKSASEDPYEREKLHYEPTNEEDKSYHCRGIMSVDRRVSHTSCQLFCYKKFQKQKTYPVTLDDVAKLLKKEGVDHICVVESDIFKKPSDSDTGDVHVDLPLNIKHKCVGQVALGYNDQQPDNNKVHRKWTKQTRYYGECLSLCELNRHECAYVQAIAQGAYVKCLYKSPDDLSNLLANTDYETNDIFICNSLLASCLKNVDKYRPECDVCDDKRYCMMITKPVFSGPPQCGDVFNFCPPPPDDIKNFQSFPSS